MLLATAPKGQAAAGRRHEDEPGAEAEQPRLRGRLRHRAATGLHATHRHGAHLPGDRLRLEGRVAHALGSGR